MDTDIEPSGKPSKLRIFQRQGKRYAMRLEDIFWLQLDDCAKASGHDLSELIFDVFDNDPKAKNRTALLRSYCVNWLRHKLTLAHLRALPLDLAAILAACPSPCFVITQERQLTAYNPAFAKEMWGFQGRSAANESSGPLQMSFARPFNKIVEALSLSPGKIIQGQMGFATKNRQIQCKVNFCLLDDQRRTTSPILIYINV
jgi:predicted DNA-binding ribbon-helix-helix protein